MKSPFRLFGQSLLISLLLLVLGILVYDRFSTIETITGRVVNHTPVALDQETYWVIIEKDYPLSGHWRFDSWERFVNVEEPFFKKSARELQEKLQHDKKITAIVYGLPLLHTRHILYLEVTNRENDEKTDGGN